MNNIEKKSVKILDEQTEAINKGLTTLCTFDIAYKMNMSKFK